ncbi:MAG: diphosphomevalonate decarboxylase [Pseudomonadota bacterium]
MTDQNNKNRVVTAVAQPNIALVKYWGKADVASNTPAVGSLSVTLSGLETRTTLRSGQQITQDRFALNGFAEPAIGERTFAFVGRLLGPARPPIDIESHNNFPTAAGLASSASGFAALTVALNALLDLNRSQHDLAVMAGRGSGSAARSLFGGAVRLDVDEGGSPPIRLRELTTAQLPLHVVVGVTSKARKQTGSTQGMQLTRATSPYYDAWLSSHKADLDAAELAISSGDFAKLADVSEHSCLKMHAVMQAANPPLLYWNAATMECIHRVRALRAAGTAAFFTIDAGPQIKVICDPSAVTIVRDALSDVAGVTQIIDVPLGGPASLVEQAA